MQSPPEDGRSSISQCDGVTPANINEPVTVRTPSPPTTPSSTPRRRVVVSPPFEEDDEPEEAANKRFAAAATRVGSGKSRMNWCYRCETMQTKLIRHMMAKHRNVPEVRRYLLTTDSDPTVQKKKRKLMCRDIASRSNHRYNERLTALGTHDGVPLPVKRSKKYEVTGLSHVVCPACKGLVTRKYFASHMRTCGSRAERGVAAAAVKTTFLLPPLDARYDGLKKDVFPNMCKDEISYVAQTDSLILQYGRRFYQTHRSHHQRYYVSSQMRTLADLLIRFRKAQPTRVKTLTDCLDPTNFDGLCSVVREWSGLDVANGRCRVGSVPRRLCKGLKVCSKINWFEAIKDKDLAIEQQLDVRNKHERFMALMECDWAMEVNGAADKSLKIQKMRKEDKMPLSEDLEKFFRVMTKKIKLATARLHDEHDIKSYTDLTKGCIVYLIVYNCRRPSEVVYASVNSYKTTLKTKNGMAVFTVPALKNDVKVPIIVTPVVRLAVTTLLDHRARLRVKGDLLFGKLDGTAYNGSNLLTSFKADMKLKKPDDFNANGFRHYLATISQLDPEIKCHIPKFLGHTLSTHQRFYEMPMSDIHLDVIGPSLSRLCRISEKKKHTTDAGATSTESTTITSTSASGSLPFSINYENPTPCTSKEVPTDCCYGITPLDEVQIRSRNPLLRPSDAGGALSSFTTAVSEEIYMPRNKDNTDTTTSTTTGHSSKPCIIEQPLDEGSRSVSSSPHFIDDVLTMTDPQGHCPSSSSSSPLTTTTTTMTRRRVKLRKRISRPVITADTESECDNESPSTDPDFSMGTPNSRAAARVETTTSSGTDSDVFASPLRVVRQKNKWTTPERKELYNGLPRTMLGLERAERGKIRSVWENSKFIRKQHSLQTTRIEVSKHFTRKKRIATPIRESILKNL